MAVFGKSSKAAARRHEHLNAEKALELLLYVSRHTRDLFHVLTTIYYADKMHLDRYGRLISGDTYLAMDDGPVPGGVYDLIRFVRGDDNDYPFDERIIAAHPEAALKASDKEIIPSREPNLDYLSESDQACLDKMIERYARMDDEQLRAMVRVERAYRKTAKNRSIPWGDIVALDLPNTQVVKVSSP